MTRYLLIPRPIRRIDESGARLKWKRMKGRDFDASDLMASAA